MIEYKFLGYAALAIVMLFLFIQIFNHWIIQKVIRAELDDVLSNKDYKVKGRYE